MRVFIVEDSDALRERLNRAISSLPHVEVIGSADNAMDAVAQIPKASPDVVILDIRLNQSSGFQVLRDLKTETTRPTIIVLTNYPYPQYRTRYLQAGADYFFDKSTGMDQVVHVLESLPPRTPNTAHSTAAQTLH
jgi:DNA-binding NarL/FixJ family response regulator